jgi:hypothetical protein
MRTVLASSNGNDFWCSITMASKAICSLKERLINAFGCAEMVAGSPLWAAHQVF